MASLPNYYVCNATKTSSDSYTLRPRIAKVYESGNYPDGKKGGVCGRHFHCGQKQECYPNGKALML